MSFYSFTGFSFVRHRVTFKIAILVFQCLTGQAPAYLADDCQLTPTFARTDFDPRTQQCASFDVPITLLVTGVLHLLVRLWNTLPAHLRQCDNLRQFKRLLKTHLFGS